MQLHMHNTHVHLVAGHTCKLTLSTSKAHPTMLAFRLVSIISKNVKGCRDGCAVTRCRDGSMQTRHVIQRLHK